MISRFLNWITRQHFQTYSFDKLRVHDFTLEEYVDYYLDLFKQRLDMSESLQFLELGCGDGWVSRALARHCPNCQFHAMDIGRENILRAQQNCDLPNVTFSQADILSEDLTPYHGRFDCIYSYQFLQYLRPAQCLTLCDQLALLLKPNGVMVHMSVPDRRHFFRYTFQPLRVRQLVKAPLLAMYYLFSIYNIRDGSGYHDRSKLARLLMPRYHLSFYNDLQWYRFSSIIQPKSITETSSD